MRHNRQPRRPAQAGSRRQPGSSRTGAIRAIRDNTTFAGQPRIPRSIDDELLRTVAGRLDGNKPGEAVVGRLGGDEFLLVLAGRNDDVADYDTIVTNIRGALDRPYQAGEREHFVNFRIGISFYPVHGRTADALIEKAASAIRTRESGSPSTIGRYNPTHAMRVSERLRMETRLKRALDEGSFRFDYQPIASLSNGRMRAVEALLRWDDDEIDDTSPSRFIPLAEQCGLILPIGAWGVSEVLRQLRDWRVSHGEWDVSTTLNISPARLQQHDFAANVLDGLEADGVPPALLQVEVTEFALALDTRRVQENLHVLNEAGVRSLIDDFGTGYCAMDYLRTMPVSTLKIDRAFVNGTPGDRHSVAITRTILALAQSLDLSTVAEGVERADQLAMLRREGCDSVQGFLLARPMAPIEIPRYRSVKLA